MKKTEELHMAKSLLDRLAKDYDTIFDEDGNAYTFGYNSMRTCSTRAKEEIRLIRRLLLEVEKGL